MPLGVHLASRTVFLVSLLGGCGRESIDLEALRDPASCAGCHPEHARAWAGSMHAHASDDPVFLAMNRLGQRTTSGALGDFCVRCHAPVAVATGATSDGLDLEQLPRALRGVTCIACHQIDAVGEIHNGDLAWTDDGTMLGGLQHPVSTPAHGSTRSSLLTSVAPESSKACGACHDVVLPNGLAIEQTFAEWSTSLFAHPEIGLSCAGCHMIGSDAPAALHGPTRRVHDHAMAAVDVALTQWPGVEDQRRGIARDLKGTISTKLCVAPGAGGVEVTITLDNPQAGHAFPSGTTHARRLWVEMVAETGGVATPITGAYQAGEVVHAGAPASAWVLGSRFRDASGTEVQLPWLAATIESDLLAPSVTADRTDPRFYHSKSRSWLVPGSPERIRLAVHLQPIGLDVLDVLIASGDLSPSARDAMPTFDLEGASLEWLAARDGLGCVQ